MIEELLRKWTKQYPNIIKESIRHFENCNMGVLNIQYEIQNDDYMVSYHSHESDFWYNLKIMKILLNNNIKYIRLKRKKVLGRCTYILININKELESFYELEKKIKKREEEKRKKKNEQRKINNLRKVEQELKKQKRREELERIREEKIKEEEQFENMLLINNENYNKRIEERYKKSGILYTATYDCFGMLTSSICPTLPKQRFVGGIHQTRESFKELAKYHDVYSCCHFENDIFVLSDCYINNDEYLYDILKEFGY